MGMRVEMQRALLFALVTLQSWTEPCCIMYMMHMMHPSQDCNEPILHVAGCPAPLP